MQNWQTFIDYNITAVIKEKMLNWPYSIINFVKELIKRCQIGHITLNAQYTNDNQRKGTVQYSIVQYS